MLTLAAVVLTAAAALAQELVTAERESFAAITRAGETIARAGDTEALLRAAEQAIAAAPRARDAFAAADRARDAAEAGYRAAYRAALAGAVTCENGYPCTNGRIDPFDGVTAAFALHFELIAAVSAANAVYVDAVGIAGGDAARRGRGPRPGTGRPHARSGHHRCCRPVEHVGRWRQRRDRRQQRPPQARDRSAAMPRTGPLSATSTG